MKRTRPDSGCTIGWLLVALVCQTARAGDWPQILGPNRDGSANGETLLERWPESGPDIVWKLPVGGGFAGVAVREQRVALFTREGKEEITQWLDAATGQVLWTSKSACNYQGGMSSDTGPRCVPTIHGDRVFVFGIGGLLRCLSVKDGSEIWRVDTQDEFSPPEGYFGAGSTPVVAGQSLIVNVGGKSGASVVAFDLANGKVVWKVLDDAPSYSAPRVATIDGRDHVFVVTRLNLVSLDPATGMVRFKFPFGQRGPTVNGATPVVSGNRVFISSSYNIGSLLVDARPPDAAELWRDETFLATQYATPVPSGNVFFAVDGRQDSGRGAASIKCLDLRNRKTLWTQEGFDYGTLINTGRDNLLLTCGGELIRFTATVAKYQEVQRATVLDPTDSGYRLPALSNGLLFVRDDAVLKALRVGNASK